MAKRNDDRREKLRKKQESDIKRSTSPKGGNHLAIPQDVKMLEVKEGWNVFDILPYTVKTNNHPDKSVKKGDYDYMLNYKVHRFIGESKKSFICPTTWGEKCPICEEMKRLYNDKDTENAKKLKPSKRACFNVRKSGSDEIMLFDVSDFLFVDPLNKNLQLDFEDEEVPLISEDITIKGYAEKKTLGKNEFLEFTKFKFLERENQDDIDEILSETVSLDTLLVKPSYDEVERAFFEVEVDDSDDTDEDEDEKPVNRKRKKDEDEEDEDDDEKEFKNYSKKSRHQDDTDEDEDEKPVNRKRKKDEEDEEDDEKPNKSKNISECPNGLSFGDDWDSDNKCDDCRLYKKCEREYENRN